MTTLATSEAADGDGVAGPGRAWALVAVLAAMVLVVLDAAIANVALPSIARSLHVTPAQSVLIVTAYQLGLVAALLPAAALGEAVGYRRVFVAGVILFIVASRFCAISPSLPWLVVARLAQGLGGAAIMALGVALLRLSVPQCRLGAAIGWNALAVALASAAGPTLGASILSVAQWPWLFTVNLPVGAVVLLASRALPETQRTGRGLDALSMALSAGAFAALVIGAEAAPSRPALMALLAVGGASMLTALIRREAPKATPLIPLDLLSTRGFRVSVIASALCFVGQTAGMLALPFYLQHDLGRSALQTGLYITPWPIAVAFAGPLAGRVVERVSTARLCAIGGLLLTSGLLAAALWPLHGEAAPLAACTFLSGAGFGLFNVSNNLSMFLSAPRARSAAAGGLQGLARLTGQMVGAVAITRLFDLAPIVIAPRIGLAFASALTLAAGAVSLLRAGEKGASAERAP